MSNKLIKIYKDFAEKWVAIDSETNEVIASGNTVKEVAKSIPNDKNNIVVSYINHPETVYTHNANFTISL